MAEYADKINAAAQAIFPELWSEANPDWMPGQLAIARQQAVERVVAGLAALDALAEEDASIIKPEEFEVPDDLSTLNDSPAASSDEDDESNMEGQSSLVGQDADGTPTITLTLPEGAKMLSQSLTIATYLDDHGNTAYTVACVGQGLTSSWLGMNVLCQDYLLRQHRENGWSPE